MSQRLERARALLELGRAAQAAELITQHLAEHEGDSSALALLSQARLELDEPQGALAAANAAIANRPDDEWPHRVASLALAATGQPEEALRAATTAVRLAPLSWVTHARLAVALADVGRYDDGWVEAELAITQAPDEPQAHRAAGRVATLASWWDEAEAAFRRALALAPDNAALMNDLGVLDLSRGRLTGAVGQFVGAARLAPGESYAPDNVVLSGWLALRQAAIAQVLLGLVIGGVLVLPHVLRSVVAGGVLVASVLLAVRTARRLPPQVRAVLRRRVLRTRRGVVVAGLLLLGLLGLSWVAAAPDQDAASIGAAPFLVGGFVAMTLASGATTSGRPRPRRAYVEDDRRPWERNGPRGRSQ